MDVKALTFDVFGTVVDWRSSLIREGQALGKAKGFRNLKYYPDVTATDRNQSNDVPIFRYADILLMKAEAILRGAGPTYNATALSLVNQLRTTRKAAPLSALSLDGMLKERALELNWENTRRIDLIRFGKYENSWGYKTDVDPNTHLPRSFRRTDPQSDPDPESRLLINFFEGHLPIYLHTFFSSLY